MYNEGVSQLIWTDCHGVRWRCVCLLLLFASTTATKSIGTDCRPDFRHRDKCSVLHGQTFYNTKKENAGGISRANDLVVWLDCVTDQTIWQRVNNAISQQFFVYLWLRQNQWNRWFIWLLLLLLLWFLASMANCVTYNLFNSIAWSAPGLFLICLSLLIRFFVFSWNRVQIMSIDLLKWIDLNGERERVGKNETYFMKLGIDKPKKSQTIN